MTILFKSSFFSNRSSHLFINIKEIIQATVKPLCEKTQIMLYADNKNADQLVHLSRLISFFIISLVSPIAVHTCYQGLYRQVLYNIRIYHECEGGIEKSFLRITVWHHEACRVMTNGNPEGRIFTCISHPHTNNGFFFSTHH